MKLIIHFLILIIFLYTNSPVVAVTTTPSPTLNITASPTQKTSPAPTKSTKDPVSTDSAEQERIQKIKEMVANRVQELKLVERRGILGTVKEVTNNTQLIIFDRNKSTRIVDIDELTKFQENTGSSKSFGISDIKAGDVLSFVGLYNKDNKRLLARFITKSKSIPLYIEGIVTDKDPRNFTFDVVDEKGKKTTIDVQSSTKTFLVTKDHETTKSGFSKIAVRKRVLAVGFADPVNKNTIAAVRVLHFENVPPSQAMLESTPNVDEEKPSPTPTTGTKITPTR